MRFRRRQRDSDRKRQAGTGYCDSKATTKYLVDVAGKWSAQAANDYMVTLLGNYNKDNNMVELIICNNDGMAEGAIAAL